MSLYLFAKILQARVTVQRCSPKPRLARHQTGVHAGAAHGLRLYPILHRYFDQNPTMTELSSLFTLHQQSVQSITAQALAATGFDELVIGSGAERYQFLDDRPYVFATNPHFKYWAPLVDHPQSWIHFKPGNKPKLIYFQPSDYWHEIPAAPSGYWVDQFDIHVIQIAAEAINLLPKPGARVAIIAESNCGLSGYEPNNPENLLNYLHFHRAHKSDYELALMRFAQTRAVRGHLAAEKAFRAGKSEYEIHLDYLHATQHTERQLPYGNIIALNQHAAVLHYQHQRHDKPLQHLSFLIDAGASHLGYAADITRTYAMHNGVFDEMIVAMDKAQLRLCDMVRASNTNSQIHIQAHLEVGKILQDFKLVNMSPEAMLEAGVTHKFFPHGIGHFLGLQVHDVGGYLKDAQGSTEPKPVGHKYLRLTRELVGNEVITIEPGIYFIDMLLEELQNSEHAGKVAWTEIDALKHYGGIRIEDNVRVVKGGAPENLTRDAFAAAAA
jgi:Xaa-Pro dipeptidase